jgi:hypothetical protein
MVLRSFSIVVMYMVELTNARQNAVSNSGSESWHTIDQTIIVKGLVWLSLREACRSVIE